MNIQRFSLADIAAALNQGLAMTRQTRSTSTLYALIYTLIGAIILGTLLLQGFTPFVIAAAGAFMLVGPITLAGFFGIARDAENGAATGINSILKGFTEAASSLWVIAMVCTLLFMIFVTDAAILYSYMVGRTPIWLADVARFDSPHPGISTFLLWGMVSGLGIAFMLFCVSAFSVPLLCERRTTLVGAIAASVRAVFDSFLPALAWALILAGCTISSVILLPLLPLTLPWLAHASRALYQRVFPRQ